MGGYGRLFAPPPAGERPLSVYVPIMMLPAFAEQVLLRIHPARRIVLVSGLADPGPVKVMGPAAVAALAGDPRVAAWFTEMPDGGYIDWRHPVGRANPAVLAGGAAAAPAGGVPAWAARLHPLPLGVDYHTLAFKPWERPYWGVPATAATQELELLAAAAAAPPGHARDSRVYVHFGWYTRQRRAVLKPARKNPAFFFDDQRSMSRAELWARYSRFKWVLCVQGGGIDCHRTWEALALGCGVVCEDLPFLRELLGEQAGDIAPSAFEATPPVVHTGLGQTSERGRGRSRAAAASVGGASSDEEADTAVVSGGAPLGGGAAAVPEPATGLAVAGRKGTVVVSTGGCPAVFIDTHDRTAWRSGLSLSLLEAAHFDGRRAPVLTMDYWRARVAAAADAAI
jgi:hypothetical protein